MKKIRAAVEDNKIQYEDKEYRMTASFGVSEYNPENDNLDSFLKRTDEALYESKETGRNKVTIKKS